MMKVLQKTVYKCDHCGKNYLHKGYAERHEKWCVRNPDNIRACRECKFLEKVDASLYESWEYGSHIRRVNIFYCQKTTNLMYPLKSEGKGNSFLEEDLYIKDKEWTGKNVPMPKTCDLFEISELNEELPF